jgi:aconitate hydratase
LGIRLTGELSPWVRAKDVILELLRRYDVKGCIGKIIEYYGPGVKALSAPERMVIGNMGTEMGATSTVFPSDENTKSYLEAHGRGEYWIELSADKEAEYDEYDDVDLSTVEPLIALPSSPGNVVPVRDAAGTKVDQVIVGSSANSDFRDFMIASKILEGKHIPRHVSLHINPGSRHILENVASLGGVIPLLEVGARIHEPGCLGCIGMGQAPGTNKVSLRTFPRNFPGRSGTKNDKVYLCSTETAVASALKGSITDPRDLSEEMTYPRIIPPKHYEIDNSSLIFPMDKKERQKIEVERGPNIKSFPSLNALEDTLESAVVIKLGDNISTDTIMPGGNQALPFRSNIQAISEFVFYQIDPEFHRKCKAIGKAVVIAGENYGQGSSREHAALAPRYLGVRAKIVKSFARIHKANLCNFGILHLTFKNLEDYDRVAVGSKVTFPKIRDRIINGDTEIPVEVDGEKILTLLEASERQRNYLLAGGALNFVKETINT